MVEYMNEEKLDLIFHALSDGTRRSLLEKIKIGPSRVTDLANEYPVSLNAISNSANVAITNSGCVLFQSRHFNAKLDGKFLNTFSTCSLAVKTVSLFSSGVAYASGSMYAVQTVFYSRTTVNKVTFRPP